MIQYKSITALLIIIFAITACNRIEKKAAQVSETVKAKSRELIDTAMNKLLPEEPPADFSIRSIVKDFQNDKSITEVKGIQVDNNFTYIEYCVYRGKKSRVLKGVNKIAAKNASNYPADQNCTPESIADFYKNIADNEKDTYTAFFWYFEQLKKYEIYTAVKTPLRHYIIFDKSSDTVYHRIEELRD